MTDDEVDVAPVQSSSDPERDGGGPSDGLRRVFRGFISLAGGGLLGQLIGFLALAFVARKIGPSNLGAYTFASALASYAGLVGDAGISYKALRDVSRDLGLMRAAVRETLVLQIGLSLMIYVVLVTLAPVLATNKTTQKMIPIVGLVPLMYAVTVDWALLALRRAKQVAIWRVIGQVAYALPIPLLVVGGATGALRYAGLNLVGMAVTAGGLAWLYCRSVDGPRPVVTARTILVRMRGSLGFAYVLVMIQVYAGVGSIMLGYLDSTRAVGLFGIANRLPVALVGLAQAWLSAFFPYAAHEMKTNPRKLMSDVGQVLTVNAMLLIALTAGSALCASHLMRAFFGAHFSGAATPFTLLALAAGLVMMQATLSNLLLALDSQRYYASILTASTFVVSGGGGR
jgi:O-antigen/teichoic acid export membrane protein